MFELMELGKTLLPTVPGVNVRISDIRIEVEPSEFLLLSIHIDGHIDIRFPW